MANPQLNYSTRIQARAAPNGRPTAVAELLLDPVGAKESDLTNYPNWEFDHWLKQRFYVGGFHWFLLNTRVRDISTICDYAEKACDLVKSKTNWGEHPAGGTEWDAFAGNQVRRAKDKKAQRFPNAAMTIVACECLLTDLHSRGEVNPKAVSVEDLYKNMSVIPAVWSIADFNKEFLKKHITDRQGITEKVIDGSAQVTSAVLTDVVGGFTFTRSGLVDLKEQVKNHAGVECGGLFGKTKDLRNASDHEEVDTEITP